MAKKPKDTAVAAPAPASPAPAPAAPAAPAAPVVAATVPPAPPAVEQVKQPEANGVTKPAPGTSTGRVWDIADSLTSQHGRPATRAEVVQSATAAGINGSTATTQFGKWAKFHGHTGAASPGKAPAATVPAAPAGATVAPATAPAAPAAPAPAAPVVVQGMSATKFDEGYEGYQRAAKGETVSCPYAEGTQDHADFMNGWTTAHTDATKAATVQ